MKRTASLKQAVLEFRGMSAQQIANVLIEANALGRRGTVRNCPFSNYCHKELGGDFVVGRKHIYKVVQRNGEKVAVEKVATPANLAEFIARFDFGDYPQLVAPAVSHRKRKPGQKRGSDKRKLPRKQYPKRFRFADEVGRF